ncbi:hypothetical protein GCM10028862_07220 [Luteimonas pelagia]
MHVHAFRFDSTRLHALFAPRKPRNPLLRLGAALLGLALLAVLLVGGLFVGLAMLAAGVVLRLLNLRGKPIARQRARDMDGQVLDGTFRVVDRHSLPSR